MDWIFLSPHLDDAALSCGGLIWEQSRAGHSVSVWTVCAGDPPPGPLSSFAQVLHARWETGLHAAARRRVEDTRSCARMAASFIHFPVPDCIYRRSQRTGGALYNSEQSLFEELHPEDHELVRSLSQELAALLPMRAILVCPLTLGGHVDHRLTRAATELLERPLWYYADYPYVLAAAPEASALLPQQVGVDVHQVSVDGMAAWSQAVAAHASQISSFWPDLDSMQHSLQAYHDQHSGLRLWKPE